MNHEEDTDLGRALRFFGPRVREDRRLGSYILDRHPIGSLQLIDRYRAERRAAEAPAARALVADPQRRAGMVISSPRITIEVKLTDSVILALVNTGRISAKDSRLQGRVRDALQMFVNESLGTMLSKSAEAAKPFL